MFTQTIRISVTALFCLWAGIAFAADCVPWSTVEGNVKNYWAKQYSNEKILKIEKSGSSSIYEKIIETGKKARGKDGGMYEVLAKTQFCGQPVKVAVMQGANKVLFNITSIYKKSGGAFIFDKISVGESSKEAGAGKEPPSNDEVKKMITDAYIKKARNVKQVDSMKLLSFKFKSAQDRWWYDFNVDFEGIRDDGKKCTSAGTSGSVFRGVINEQGKDPKAPWTVDVYPNGCY